MANSFSGIFGVVSDVTRKEGNSPTRVRLVNEPTMSDNPEDKIWVTATIWDDRIGRVAEQYFQKGTRIFADGVLEPRTYKEKQYWDFNLKSFTFAGSGASDKNEKSSKPKQEKVAKKEESDDDIPF